MPRELDTPIAHAYRAVGMNAEEVAEQLGISPTYMYEIARQSKLPSVRLLGDLCRVLRKTPQELLPDIFLPTNYAKSVVGKGRVQTTA